LFRLFEPSLFLTGFGEDHAGFDCVFGFDFPQRDEGLLLWLVSEPCPHLRQISKHRLPCRDIPAARMSPNTIEWVDRLAPVKTLPFGMSWKTTLTNERGAPVASQ